MTLCYCVSTWLSSSNVYGVLSLRHLKCWNLRWRFPWVKFSVTMRHQPLRLLMLERYLDKPKWRQKSNRKVIPNFVECRLTYFGFIFMFIMNLGFSPTPQFWAFSTQKWHLFIFASLFFWFLLFIWNEISIYTFFLFGDEIYDFWREKSYF